MKKIRLWGIKQNNLKNIEVEIPLGSFTVICGPSGSGKSSLAFETLYAEGQRRYIESLSTYARQFIYKAPKPDIEGIENIPPAIAIEQKNSVRTSRSTVGTSTEVVEFLRLLFEKVGKAHCPTYGFSVKSESVTEATRITLGTVLGKRGYVLAPVLRKGRVGDGARLQALLIKEGFTKIYLHGQSEGIVAVGKERPKVSLPAKKKSSRETSKAEKKISEANGDGVQGFGFPKCVSPDELKVVGQIIELRPKENVIPDEDFFLVIDRMAFKNEDEGRLSDSISQAYQASTKFNAELAGGRATILTIEGRELKFSEENSCSVCGFTFPNVSSQLFSFNSPIGACSKCNGFGNILTLDESKIIPNPALTLAEGAIHPFTMPSASYERKVLASFCKREGIDMHTPWSELSPEIRQKIWAGDEKYYGVNGMFEYLEGKKYKMHVRVFLSRYKSPFTCPDCGGSRLKPESKFIKVNGYTIQQLTALPLGVLRETVDSFRLSDADFEIAGEIFKQLKSRLKFLCDVGVEYLSLDRETRTLSGGEYQRLNLAKQLGMGLSQTLYVLDEPTVGLHPRDNDRLIGILKELNSIGNTLVVVEHDPEVIKSSDYLLEMGPGSGIYGGEVVYHGLTAGLYGSEKSVTAPYLLKTKHDSKLSRRLVDFSKYKSVLKLTGCRGHNLKGVTATFPLRRMVTVTGVSGSGKSTLVAKTLYPILAQHLRVEYLPIQPYESVEGLEQIKSVLFIDQSPIGKSARSNPVTYLKIYDAIRSLMASTTEAKLRGYSPGTFSLNVDGGRCSVCKGLGFELIDMMFMDDVRLVCEACEGRKFRAEVLDIKYKGKNITDILDMTVAEAMDFFMAFPNIRKPLTFLREVGLDYIKLGQSASTLSGGESQRLKIAREFVGSSQNSTLYILDEPTTGLHFREVEMLLNVLNKLVDGGGSVILVEHNLEVIRASDFVIDLGPEAGDGGGRIVAQGSPDDIIENEESLTGRYLREYCCGPEVMGKGKRSL